MQQVNTNRIIVAFAGSKGSGKTTAFEEVKNNFENVVEITLAGTLKRACCEVFNFNKDKLFDQKYKEEYLEDPIILTKSNIESILSIFNNDQVEYDKFIRQHVGMLLETPRQALQYVGTDILHPIDKLIHVKAAIRDLPKDGIAVITDLRFEQEFNYFRENHTDFFPFYIKNPVAEAAAAGDKHPSETQLHNFKHLCKLIENNKSLPEFRQTVVNEIRNIL